MPLEVVTRSTAVPDPMPVAGTTVAYADFEAALGHAVSTAAAPWADTHRDRRPNGWQLFVEVTDAEAKHVEGRTLITIGVRATLKTRGDNVFLGQTETACEEGGLAPPERAASVLYACMSRIGRDLTSWLGAVEPDVPKPPPPPDNVDLAGAVGSSGAADDEDSDGDGIPDRLDPTP